MPVRQPYLSFFSQRLQRMRKDARLTQEALAERAGLNAKYLSELERATKWPSLAVLKQIADGLQTTPSALLDETDDVGRQIQAILSPKTETEKQIALRLVRALFDGRLS